MTTGGWTEAMVGGIEVSDAMLHFVPVDGSKALKLGHQPQWSTELMVEVVVRLVI